VRRKIAPKNSPEKKKKKWKAENCRALKIKKSITLLLPTNFFEPSRAAAENFQKTLA
jgi:hypothetical protein